jgi:ATP-dependent protease HslVU (ClpYQ) peptidase subunit
MAGDTRISNESDIDVSAFRKVFHLKGGSLIGFAGNVGDIQKAIDQLKVNPNNLGFQAEEDEFEALLVLSDGKVRHYEDRTWYDIDAKYFSIGSGGDYANVAMHMGADPRRAVQVAMHFDKGTGGKIHVVKLKSDLGKRSKKR